MESGEDLFLKILNVLNKDDLLQQIVLIGSWVLPVYRDYFNNDPEIPVLRTTDVDFLIEMPPHIRGSFDIPGMLSEIGFEPEWSLQGEFCKYVHPDLEIEFLIPEHGRSIAHSIKVIELGVMATPLRFLSLAHKYSMVVVYRGYNIRVPEPESFLFLKLLVIPRRKDTAKAMKDVSTARALSEFLITRNDRRKHMQEVFNDLPKGWQTKIKGISKEYVPILFNVITGN